VLVRAGRRPKCTRNRGTGQRSTLLPARGGRSFTRASDSDAIRRPKSKSDSNRTPAASDRVCLPAHVREVSLAATPRHRQGCARQRLHRRYSLSLSLALLSWIKYVHSSARYAVFPWIARIPCSRSSRDLRSGRRRNVCGTKSVYLHRNRARILELTGLTVSDTASCNILVFNSSILHRKRERERERAVTAQFRASLENDSQARVPFPTDEGTSPCPETCYAHCYAIRLRVFFIAERAAGVQRSVLILWSKRRNETATAVIARVGLRIVCLDAKQIASQGPADD